MTKAFPGWTEKKVKNELKKFANRKKIVDHDLFDLL